MEQSAEKSVATLGWLLITVSVVVNIWLTYRVGEFRFGGGAKHAQADFELFMLLLTFGIPTALFAVIFLMVIALTKLRSKNIFVAMATNAAALLCTVNVLIPISLIFYLFRIT